MATVHRLRIGSVGFEYRIEQRDYAIEIGELFIDERPLADWLGSVRHLGNCHTDFDPRTSAPRRAWAREAFLGLTPADNQNGSGRLVLYRCHCGCDYCGVVSCLANFDGDHVVWDQLTYETEDGPMLERDPDEAPEDSLFPPSGPLRFVFDRAQYRAELERHFAP